MFISEEEALERLKSSDNLLNRIGVRHSETGPIQTPPEPEPEPEVIDDPNIDPVRAAVLAGRKAMGGTGRGRYPGQKNTPPEIRSLIGATAQLTSAEKAAKMFGISAVAAHHYSHGRTSQNAEPKQSLLDSIENDTQGIRKQVLGVLAFTIAGITPDKIENKDAKELSIIARNLGSIMSATKPPADFGDKTTNAQVIVFSPEQEQESFYPTKEIG
jgi:hypothetical protein